VLTGLLRVRGSVKELGLTNPQIVRGGAEIVEAQTGKVLHGEYLDAGELRLLVEFLIEHHLPFFAEEGEHIYADDGLEKIVVPVGVTVKPLDEMPDERIAKLLVITSDLDERRVKHLLNDIIGQRLPSTHIVKSYRPFLKAWTATSQRKAPSTWQHCGWPSC